MRKRTPTKVNKWMQGSSQKELYNETAHTFKIPQFPDQSSNDSNKHNAQCPFDFEFSPQYKKD
jgi:hypothetical protein